MTPKQQLAVWIVLPLSTIAAALLFIYFKRRNAKCASKSTITTTSSDSGIEASVNGR